MAPDVSTWPVQQLRLAYFDFTCRGEGDAPTVRAVLREWLSRRAIDRPTYELWSDALAWRESGNLLPGWTVPAAGPLEPAIPAATEEDYGRFLSWRATKVAA